MDYKKKYIKYKGKYKMAKYKYLHNLKILEVKKYQINIFNKYYSKLDDLDVIEFGVGNAAKSIRLSELFNTYVGVEPDETLYKLAKSNCEIHDCKIKLINTSAEDYNKSDKHDIIIFINTFHFVNNMELLRIIKKSLKLSGIVYIEEPKPIPRGWGSPSLNKSSPEFDVKKWNIKKNNLIKSKQFIMNNLTEYGLNVDYYDIKKDIFVIYYQK